MLDPIKFAAGVSGDVWWDQVEVDAWTNIHHADNPEGKWKAVPLHFSETNTHGHHVYRGSVVATGQGDYKLTFRAKMKKDYQTSAEESYAWASQFKMDCTINVAPPNGDKYTQGPQFTRIMGSVYIGNFVAASQADKLKFDSVLNVADNLDILVTKFKSYINYKKIPLAEGAQNTIPEKCLSEAVMWLQRQYKDGLNTLINSRSGIGRAGSVVIAFVYATDRGLSYDDAKAYVSERHFIYPHRGLRETLLKMFPRHLSQDDVQRMKSLEHFQQLQW